MSLKEVGLIIVTVFCVALIYLFEYSIMLGLTFKASRENKALEEISIKVEQLRVKAVKLSRYERMGYWSNGVME